MVAHLLIIVLSCLGLIALVIKKPSVEIKGHGFSIYWAAPLLGAFILLLTGGLSGKELISGLFAEGSINPVKILVLFISMTMLSIFLDEIGFFKYLAAAVLSKAGGSKMTLFVMLYLMVSVLTVFTSNDIIILTFTPFICHFAKNAKIDPMPYLFAEFVAANTWSMALIIGNPTNVYLATACGISFFEYVKVMLLPTVAAGVVSFIMLYLVFRKQLRDTISVVPSEEKIEDKGALVIGLAHLALCTVALVLSSWLNQEMWFIALFFVCSLFAFVLVYRAVQRKRPTALLMCIKRAPWELVPFIFSMFVFVLTLKNYGLTENFRAILGEEGSTLKYGLAAFLSANVINNIPMSVLFSAITEGLAEQVRLQAVFGAVAGSNLGAFFTPIGALAGIMWSNILKRHELKFSFLTFIRYGVLISVPAILATLAVLTLQFL